MTDNIPCIVKEIQERIEKNAEEEFIDFSVPELFFWGLGVEYIGNSISFEVK